MKEYNTNNNCSHGHKPRLAVSSQRGFTEIKCMRSIVSSEKFVEVALGPHNMLKYICRVIFCINE